MKKPIIPKEMNFAPPLQPLMVHSDGKKLNEYGDITERLPVVLTG